MSPGKLPLVEIELCARAAHEMNRVYCIAIGDDSQPPWEAAPEWQKDSAREGVIAVLQGATPEQSHDAWTAHKRREGWVYGAVKDPVAKTHPCMVGYHELPPQQREKDELFGRTVKSMAQALGLEVH